MTARTLLLRVFCFFRKLGDAESSKAPAFWRGFAVVELGELKKIVFKFGQGRQSVSLANPIDVADAAVPNRKGQCQHPVELDGGVDG